MSEFTTIHNFGGAYITKDEANADSTRVCSLMPDSISTMSW